MSIFLLTIFNVGCYFGYLYMQSFSPFVLMVKESIRLLGLVANQIYLQQGEMQNRVVLIDINMGQYWEL